MTWERSAVPERDGALGLLDMDPPSAPLVAVASVEPSADATDQLDLLAWRPPVKPLPPPVPPREPVQLSLFDEPG